MTRSLDGLHSGAGASSPARGNSLLTSTLLQCVASSLTTTLPPVTGPDTAPAGAALGGSLRRADQPCGVAAAPGRSARATARDVHPKESVMSNRNLTESGRDRAALARGAGFGRFSFVSVLAGVLVAYGGLAVLLSAAYGINQATGVAGTLSFDDLARLGVGSATVIVAATLVAYLFGGYVAGRMARRAGL